jgi:hypothetical protein
LRSEFGTTEEGAMRKAEPAVSWVVYLMTLHNNPGGMNAVCEQSEWEEMERSQPGFHKLVRAGIPSEAEAERLARGTSGDARKSPYPRRR